MNNYSAIRTASLRTGQAERVDPRSSIHLVYPRNPQPESIGAEKLVEMPRAARPRRNDGMNLMLLAGAAFSAPLVWVGHALFEWMRTR